MYLFLSIPHTPFVKRGLINLKNKPQLLWNIIFYIYVFIIFYLLVMSSPWEFLSTPFLFFEQTILGN